MASEMAKITKREHNSSEIIMLLPSVEKIFSNEDLLTLILLRVPAQSVIKFKCVSKDWCKIISHSRFVYNHHAINRNVVSGIYLYYGSLEKVPLKTLSFDGHVNLVTLPFVKEFGKPNNPFLWHSCNGLALFSVSRKKRVFIVCNLTTQKYVVLPCNSHLKFASRGCLAFDPAISPYYKVVMISYIPKSTVCPINIYSSKNQSWKHVCVNAAIGNYRVAFLDGAVHWVHESNNYFRFMVDDEKLITTQLPQEHKILKWYNFCYFGECGDQLVLIQCERRLLCFDVLEMKRGTCCWSVKYKVNLKPVMDLQPTEEYYVLGIVKEPHGSDLVLVLATPRKLILYDLKQRNVNLLDFSENDYHSLNSYSHCFKNFPCIQSLLPVSCNSGK